MGEAKNIYFTCLKHFPQIFMRLFLSISLNSRRKWGEGAMDPPIHPRAPAAGPRPPLAVTRVVGVALGVTLPRHSLALAPGLPGLKGAALGLPAQAGAAPNSHDLSPVAGLLRLPVCVRGTLPTNRRRRTNVWASST